MNFESWNSPPAPRRFILFVCALLAITAALVARYAIVMLGGNEAAPAASGRAVHIARGPILDRNGRLLAVQTRLGNVTAWRPEIRDLDETVRLLAPVLLMAEDIIKERLSESPTDFVYLKKRIDAGSMDAIEGMKIEGRLRGIRIEPVFGRIYPENKLAGQVIGFVGDENSGLAGIEYAFNADLSGKNNNPVSETNDETGAAVMLTIDINIQNSLEDIAASALRENNAEAVMLLAMDALTGEILGSASLPNFDPNDFQSYNIAERMDKPALWAFEPGSVFKVFSLAAMLDAGAISEQSVFVCDGHYERTTNLGEKVVINCLGQHGRVTAREILVFSCNAGAAYASDTMGQSVFDIKLRDMGFGARTGAGVPGETAGVFSQTSRWSARSKPTIAIGQEIAVSALQILQAATAIANKGVMTSPRLVRSVIPQDGRPEQPFVTPPPRKVLSAETTAAILDGMRAGAEAEGGIGRRAGIADIPMAVKTGTAQITDNANGKYSETDYIASTLALLPADNPSLIIYMAITRPKGRSYFGAAIAAPAIREAAQAVVNYLGLPRGLNPQVSHSGEITIPRQNAPQIDGIVPDFTGMSKQRILPLLLRDDIAFNLSGNGWVARQSPPPGTPVTPGMVITLEFE
jgi:cell division protein FtsI (penicillin-binding protein 3)